MSVKTHDDPTLRPGDLFMYPDDFTVYEYVCDGTGDEGEPQQTVREHEGPTSGPPPWVTLLGFAIGTVAVGLVILSLVGSPELAAPAAGEAVLPSPAALEGP